MWKIVKLGYSRSPWRLVGEDGMEVATTCSNTGVQHPVCGQTRTEVESWALDRLEWYARNARAGVIPAIYSPNWRNTAEIVTTATVYGNAQARFEEWFEEYDKQNHYPKMLARAAWNAALAATAPQPAQAAQGAWEAIISQCMVTEAVTPDPADPYGTIGKLMDYAAAAQQPVAVDGAMEVPHQECYSNDDGDTWLDSPEDAEFVDGLALGDEFELSVSHYPIRRTYRVTKVPGEDSDDYEIEPVAALRSGSQGEGQ